VLGFRSLALDGPRYGTVLRNQDRNISDIERRIEQKYRIITPQICAYGGCDFFLAARTCVEHGIKLWYVRRISRSQISHSFGQQCLGVRCDPAETERGSRPSYRNLVISSSISCSRNSWRKNPDIPDLIFFSKNPCTMTVPSAVNPRDKATYYDLWSLQ
jgi:hypothetical protein